MLGGLCGMANLKPQGDEHAAIRFERNVARPTPGAPPRRKDLARHYYEVVLRVRPADPAGRPGASAVNRAIRWNGRDATRTYFVKRLGVEISITVRSDDAVFGKAIHEIFDRHISQSLRGTGTD